MFNISENSLNMRRLICNKRVVIPFVVITMVCIFSISVSPNKKVNMGAEEYNKDLLTLEDVGVPATDNDVEITYNDAPKNTSQSTARTTISIEDTGRADPFLPENEIVIINPKKHINKPKPSYDLLPPPETITTDATAEEVMTTKVSGLMYDKTSPSAIININNSDFLVRKGDVVNEFKVIDIDRTSVTVMRGANVYKAGVGELFTGKGVNYNTISNLENKFGGAAKSTVKK